MSGSVDTARTPTAAQLLLDTTRCPRCGAVDLQQGRCALCLSDFSGPEGAALWQASQAVAAAMEHRQRMLDAIPRVAAAAAQEPPRPSSVGAAPVASNPPPPGRPAGASRPLPAGEPRSSATVQSVLAIAGAGLVAVAAIVFTFFNPDLTDDVARSLIVAVTTLVFLVGARTLAGRQLRFWAEAVGALGLLFLGLDVTAVARLLPSVDPWLATSVGTLVAGTIALVLAATVRLRVWLWGSVIALALVPAMAAAAGSRLWVAVGWTLTAAAACALIALLRGPVARRFARPTMPEQWTLTIVQIVACLAGSVAAAWAVIPTGQWLIVGAQLTVVAALSAVSTRHPARGLWSFAGGSTGTAAFVAALPAASPWVDPIWLASIAPAAAAVGLLVWAGSLRLPASVDRPLLATGAVVAVGWALVPVGLLAGSTVMDGLVMGQPSSSALVEVSWSFAPVVGLAAASVVRKFGGGPRGPDVAYLSSPFVWLSRSGRPVPWGAPGR